MDNAKIMTDAEKTQQMCDFSKRLAVRMGAFEKRKQELADAESQRKKAQVFRDDVISKVMVTSDLGWKFAEKYSMDINGSVGQYIEKLNNIKYAKMTLQQKQMVLTILFAGLFSFRVGLFRRVEEADALCYDFSHPATVSVSVVIVAYADSALD